MEQNGRGSTTQKDCPDCGTILPVHHGYVTWCDRCNWNLKPHDPDAPQGLFQKLYAAQGERSARNVYDELIKAESLRPRMTWARVAALMIAMLVHGLTVALLVTGGMLIALGWPNIVMIAGGGLCLAIVVVLRPRFGKIPDEVLSPEEFPALHELADNVADALGGSKVDCIVVDTEFNASFGRRGIEQKSVLTLGLPLFTLLGDEERIALIGHELGHDMNGDYVRGLFVGTAITSLDTWYELVLPDDLMSSEGGAPGLLMIPINLALYVVAGGIRSVLVMLSHLLWRDSQRAEYLADHIGARAGGTAGALTMLDRLHLTDTYTYVVQRVALNLRGANVFDELCQEVETMPEREYERVRRVAQMENSRLDVSHPPTRLRIASIQAQPFCLPCVTISEDQRRQLHDELTLLSGSIQRTIVDQHLNSLYY